MPLEPGALLADRFRLTRVLVPDEQHAFYLAHDESLGQPCAIRESPNPSPEAERRFRREAAALAALRHRALPRVIHHFVSGGRQYQVTSVVEGEDLAQRLQRQGRLPEPLVHQWALQLCDLLIVLHGLHPPIVGRDLQPANLRVNPGGEVMLVDLGPRRPAAAAEEAPAEAVQAGLSGDQYALAATLYTLLTGQPPSDPAERRRGVAALIAPHVLRPDLSPATALAVTRALAIQPEARYPDLAAFRRALLSPPAADTGATVGHRLGPQPAELASPAPEPLPSTVPSAPHDPAAGRGAARGPGDDTLPRPSTAPVPEGATLVVPGEPAAADPLDTLSALPSETPTWAGPLPPQVIILPPGPEPPPRSAAPRPRWLLPVGLGCGLIVLLVLALAGGSALGRFLGGSNPTGTPFATATVRRAAQPASATPRASRTPTPTASSAAAILATATAPPPTETATLPPAPSATPTVPGTVPGTPIGSGGRLAFISDRDGSHFQIYTMNVDGSDVRQVTTDPADKWRPEWTFNGTQLAWSPDGAGLLYVAEGVAGDTDLWLIPASGGTSQNLTAAAGDDFQPAWCRDGTIWFASTRTNGIHQIFTTSLERVAQGLRPVNFSSTHNSPREFDPAPYPDCERAMFVSTLDAAVEIWRYWPDCPACFGKARTHKAQSGRAEEPALSPDGLRLAYTQVLADHAEIVLADAEDETPGVPLTGGQGGFSAQWSPDGRWLVFVSLRDGNREVYVMDTAGEVETNLTRHPATDTDPVWQPPSP